MIIESNLVNGCFYGGKAVVSKFSSFYENLNGRRLLILLHSFMYNSSFIKEVLYVFHAHVQANLKNIIIKN